MEMRETNVFSSGKWQVPYLIDCHVHLAGETPDENK